MTKARDLADIIDSNGIDITGGLTTTGNVGIGTTSPSVELEIASSAPQMRITDTDTNAVFQINASSTTGGVELQADATNVGSNPFMAFDVGGSEKVRILDNNKLLVGKTVTTEYESGCIFHTGASVNAVISADNDALIVWADNGTANTGGTKGHVLFKRGTNSVLVGSITSTTTATAYSTSSDYRLKENAVDMTGSISRVKSLEPKRFNFIADTTNTLVDGFMAHEVQTVVPEAITGTHNEVDADGNPVYQGIDQSKLVPLLTGALQEAIAKIEALETEMTALKARVTTLEGN